MADSPDADSLVKREPEGPAPDPVASRSTSGYFLIGALLLMAVTAWALYDEVYGTRPWKGIQQEFAERYNRYLRSIRGEARRTVEEVRASAEYQALDQEAQAKLAAVEPRQREIDSRTQAIDRQVAAVTEAFQDGRARVTAINYEIETTDNERRRQSLREEREEVRQAARTVDLPAADGSARTERRQMSLAEIEQLYNSLKDEKARLLAERAELMKEYNEAVAARSRYLQDNVIGLTEQQINSLITRNENAVVDIRQIHIDGTNVVDRCETCHLGAREPLRLTPAMMQAEGARQPDALARAFVSHPNRALLQLHDPDRFGCATCHGGNGRATTSIQTAHGLNKHWPWPLHHSTNVEAGCYQCHTGDRVLEHAPTLTRGMELFQQRGCIGCHRHEEFDREIDALAGVRQQIRQFEDQKAANERDSRQADAEAGSSDISDEEAQRLRERAVSLLVVNSQLDARIEQLNTQVRYLMQDRKMIGPTLKDIRAKLRPEWLAVWLRDPQAFRPGTRMPSFRLPDDEIQAISAFLWQSAHDARIPAQPQGDATRGREMFETIGCLACHSIGEGSERIGSDFAANLTRVGQKANYDYIVRWILNPRQRLAPFSPALRRDLTREDYESRGVPFIFDEQHSRSPIDGSELQVQNMTVMPSFRLSEQDARDIATYLFSLTANSPPNYPAAAYVNDTNLRERGMQLVRQYGCASCHEISGLENEQRIGTELTVWGSKPMERLDFALLTHAAERGIDPRTGQQGAPWYNHRGFFLNKVQEPDIYDRDLEGRPRERDASERLRMPRPYLTEEDMTALATFVLGSVEPSVPRSMFYNPSDRRRDIQEGWWVVTKYNCMGCHTVQVGQESDLSRLPFYQTPEGREQLPPHLTTQGARVNPDWLIRFLQDPSLSAHDANAQAARERAAPSAGAGNQARGQPAQPAATNGQTAQNGGGLLAGIMPGAAQPGQPAQAGQQQPAQGVQPGQTITQFYTQLARLPGENRNGVRTYLRARMPTFNFSPNELRILVRFFQAIASQQEPYIREPAPPLTEQERTLARLLFTSQQAPCLRCHVTGDPARDRAATAPSFLQAGERLQHGWTFRWLLDPQRVIPGTSMPSDLFRREGDRWVFNATLPPIFNEYRGDHAELLTRYLLQMTPEEQRRAAAAMPAAAGSAATPVARSSRPPATGRAQRQQTGRNNGRRRGPQEVSRAAPVMPHGNVRARAPGEAIGVAHRARAVGSIR